MPRRRLVRPVPLLLALLAAGALLAPAAALATTAFSPAVARYLAVGYFITGAKKEGVRVTRAQSSAKCVTTKLLNTYKCAARSSRCSGTMTVYSAGPPGAFKARAIRVHCKKR